jgi:hypothetical protein
MRSGRHISDASTLLNWHKSSYSGGSNGNCLETSGSYPTLVPVRDSKNPTGPALIFSSSAWSTFVGDVKAQRTY